MNHNYEVTLHLFEELAEYYPDIGGSCTIIDIEHELPDGSSYLKFSDFLSDKIIVAYDSEYKFLVTLRITDGKIFIIKENGDYANLETRIEFDNLFIGDKRAWHFLGRVSLLYPIQITIDKYWNELS